MKDLHIQMQNHKELLTKLQPELELKKARKAELEAELRTLTSDIEADEKKMVELPESMEKIRKEATTTMTAGKQLLMVKIRQPSHEFTFGVGMTFVSYSLVLTPVV
jgi:predicted  nucleic acid-binding Zn-ribbon protein